MSPGRGALLSLALAAGCAPAAAPQAATQDPDSTRAAIAAEHAMSGAMDVADLHMKVTPARPAAPGDSARAAALVTRMRSALGKYRDVHAAATDGFRQFQHVNAFASDDPRVIWAAHHHEGYGGDAPLTRRGTLRLARAADSAAADTPPGHPR